MNIRYSEKVTGFLAWYVRTNRNSPGILNIFIVFVATVAFVVLAIRVPKRRSDSQADARKGTESEGEVIFIDRFNAGNKGWNLNHWRSQNPQKTNRIENSAMVFEATESDWPQQNENGANLNLRNGIHQGNKYEVICKVRSDRDTTMQFKLWLHDTTGGDSEATDFRTPSTKFEEVKLEYTANETEAMRIHLHCKAGEGRIIVDEVVVRKI